MDELFQLCESFFAKKFEECAGFASGDDQAVDGVELLGLFDEHDLGAELFEPAAVGVEIALQGQNSDFHGGIDSSGWGIQGRACPRAKLQRVPVRHRLFHFRAVRANPGG